MCCAKIAQLVEHFHGKEEVPGSIPGLGSTLAATLAQLVEHHFRKVGVRSSILRGGSLLPIAEVALYNWSIKTN